MSVVWCPVVCERDENKFRFKTPWILPRDDSSSFSSGSQQYYVLSSSPRWQQSDLLEQSALAAACKGFQYDAI